MATKLNNHHLENIILNSKHYNILDTYIALSHISCEVKNKYLIQTYTNNKADIINQVKKYVSSSYKTLYNNIDELIRLNILAYDNELSSWYLVDMEKMHMSKNDTYEIEEKLEMKGYTKIRKFFLSSEFHKMRSREKRCMIFLAQLCDSKAAKSYTNFSINLIKPNSRWLQILKTKCKYYAKYTIETMLKKYNEILINESETLRSKDFAPSKISNFKFAFKCSVIEKIEDDNTQYELISMHHSNELNLVKERIRFANITLSKVQMMHIVRSICTIKEWFLKERIVQIIINKFIAIQIHKSREKIHSLPAYLVAVVKGIINEFNEFRKHVSNLNNIDIGLAYKYNSNDENSCSNYDIEKDINLILKSI